MTPKLGKYNLIDQFGKGRIINPKTPHNPNLDNCGPWKQGQKSPIYKSKIIKKCCLINRGNRGKLHGKTPPQDKQ